MAAVQQLPSPAPTEISTFVKQQPFTTSLVLYMLLFGVILIGNWPLKVKSIFVYSSPICLIGLLGIVTFMSGELDLSGNYLIWAVILAVWLCVIIVSRTTLITKEKDIKGDQQDVDIAFAHLGLKNYGQEQWGLSPIGGGILAFNFLLLLVISCILKGKGADNSVAFTLCFRKGKDLVPVHTWTLLAIVLMFLFTSTLCANFMDLIYAQSNYIARVKERAKINNNLSQIKAPLDKVRSKLKTTAAVLGVGTLLFTLAVVALLVLADAFFPEQTGGAKMEMILAFLFCLFAILIILLWFLSLVPSQQQIKNSWKKVAK